MLRPDPGFLSQQKLTKAAALRQTVFWEHDRRTSGSVRNRSLKEPLFSLFPFVQYLILVTRHLSLLRHVCDPGRLSYFGQAARSFAAISLYSASGSFLLGAGVPGAFPPKEGMT